MSQILQNLQLYQNFDPIRFNIELTYSLLVAIIFLFVYFKTKSLFDLTNHKGIKYFRLSLLFFSLAFISRVIFNLIRAFVIYSEYHLPGRSITFLSLIFITYLSTFAIGYLIYSLNWKKINHTKYFLILKITTILFLLIFFLQNSFLYFILLQIMLLLIIFFQKTNPKIKIIYLTLASFWIFNIMIFYSRNFTGFELKLAFQLISLIILTYFVYKILKWTK